MTSSGEDTFVDYYALLDLRPSADASQIKAAFMRKAKQHHPDAGGSTEHMQQLTAAYRALKSSSSKAAYDMMHNFQTGATQMSDYKYEGGKQVGSVSDMSDDQIDDFLDSLYNEYRHAPPKPKETLLQKLKKLI